MFLCAVVPLNGCDGPWVFGGTVESRMHHWLLTWLRYYKLIWLNHGLKWLICGLNLLTRWYWGDANIASIISCGGFLSVERVLMIRDGLNFLLTGKPEALIVGRVVYLFPVIGHTSCAGTRSARDPLILFFPLVRPLGSPWLASYSGARLPGLPRSPSI